MKASKTPLQAIESVTYPGQSPERRKYHEGYEHFMDSMPEIKPDDLWLQDKVLHARSVMQLMASELKMADWPKENPLPDNGFDRTILAIENPISLDAEFPGGKVVKEGAEIVMARWGNGFTSPVHGHAAGYMHEEILFGKMRVNTYQIVGDKLVRPLRTEIVGEGTFVSQFSDKPERTTLIHNFTSIGFSASLHFLPEHTRDGRDNRFEVEEFNNLSKEDVRQITAHEGLYMQIGDVALVRSTNVPEYGDHFIVITGHPVVKEHGLRPQDIEIQASAEMSKLLDCFEQKMGLTLLKLSSEAATEFKQFHNIKL